MSDISALSNEDLMRLIGPQSAAPAATASAQPSQALSALSDADLLAHIKATEPKSSLATDVGKSAVAGLGEGAIGAVGTIGDIRSALSSGASYLGGKLGISPEMMAAAKQAVTQGLPVGQLIASAPTSAELKSGVEGITGPFYQSQTVPGEISRTIAQFAPAAITGPGGIVRRVVTQDVLPALASMAAGKAAEGTGYEPYAKAGAAFLAGAGSGAIANRAAKEILPTMEQVRASGSAGFQHPEVEAVQIKPTSVNDLANNITMKLQSAGYRPTNTESGKPVFDSVSDLKIPTGTSPSLNIGASMGAGQKVVSPGTPAAPATVADLQAVRKNLGVMGAEVNAQGKPTANAAAAQMASREIGNYLQNLKSPDLLAGNAQRASQILADANKDWSSQAKALDVNVRLTRAERQAAKSGMGANIDNAIRQKISAILDVPSRTVGYTPEEIAQMEQVVRGSPVGNVSRTVGKLGPHGALSMMANIAAGVASHGLSIPVSAVGYLGRKLGETSTKANAAELERMILRRSALAQTPQYQPQAPYFPNPANPAANIPNPYYIPPPNPLNPLYSGLLAASGANR